ncbi:hypothetical protein SSP531S_18430 [Streptomyces spongiicola]|uniref:Uncharacterized protein n=1 Tax=Streptomyces spongiicola TaxID=1690221 RepID=A0A388SUW4_9ACTN|nr:hypothetical protein SSP531S_18430 [Streptomyces spongiicola]
MNRAVDFSFGVMIGIVCAAMVVELCQRRDKPSLGPLRAGMFASGLVFLVLYIVYP